METKHLTKLSNISAVALISTDICNKNLQFSLVELIHVEQNKQIEIIGGLICDSTIW